MMGEEIGGFEARSEWDGPLVHSDLRPAARRSGRDRRAKLEPRDLTAWFFGDPLPGMSALDLRDAMNEPIEVKY
jgi:hypothetical protein